ncbi:MAG: Efflux transporter periplasmic adaptor subunit [uncultured Thiotrichaceae bacterium]|uniref:Efflux transporter periplasmic adaptor subunit n=1 Tax=uncultured Thiotrichaceae bacterium TaxID=298394 RepID=A0A6S6TH23_9GAMM|nr:MAG: Efflux transporter periplasmic adaptor subunit [uncultured Thiotrichaceae bacterium]
MINNYKAALFGLVALLQTASLFAEIPLQTHVIEKAEVPLVKVLNGRIEAVNRSTVSAQTNGSIETLNYDVGDLVEKSAVIARIKSRSQQAGLVQAKASVSEAKASAARAKATYRSAQARSEEAASNFQRVKKIYEQKLISRSEYDRSAAATKSAKAEVGAAKAAYEATLSSVTAAQAGQTQAGEQLGYTEILAPYSGIVIERHVELGEVVSEGKPIMTGISLDQLRVSSDVPQSMINAVRKYKKASVLLPESGKKSAVTSFTIFPYADSLTNTFKVRAKFPEKMRDVYPGSFVKIAFTIGKKTEITLPESMIVYRGEVTGVYVVDKAGQPLLRQIKLGQRIDNNKIVVLSGLEFGETIAVDPTHATLFLKRAIKQQETAHE